VPGGRAIVVGKVSGTLAIVLPGGPGMDFGWARPALDGIADTVAYLEPAAVEEGGQPSAIVVPAALTGLLEALKRPNAVLVSDGLGGTAALWLAVQVPDAVAGVVAVAAPLPGAIDAFDAAFLAAVPEPYRGLAGAIAKDDARFHPEALDGYVGRLLATGMAGRDARPESVLGVRTDLARSSRARAVLSRPEVRFAPTEMKGPALWLGPLSSLPEDLRTSYMDVAGLAPGRVRIEDRADCGFLPTVVCEGLFAKRIRNFVRETSGR
jgi:pimeloyl-ACP methyl ester carboxylesterase